jgi:hypothetical protein
MFMIFISERQRKRQKGYGLNGKRGFTVSDNQGTLATLTKPRKERGIRPNLPKKAHKQCPKPPQYDGNHWLNKI